MNAILDHQAQAVQNLNQCAACGGQLAVLAGTLVRGLQPGAIIARDAFGQVAATDLEQGPDGQPTDRARRQIFVGCGSCRQPAPLDHPMQYQLDADWRAADARDQAERERAARAPRARVTPYKELNPVLDAEDRLDRLEKMVSQLQQEIALLKSSKRKAG